MSESIKDRIEKALSDIRPYLEADGGDVKILDVSGDMVVTIELLGACSSCPMSAMTLKAGVEEAIKKVVPEVKLVEAANVTPIDGSNAKLPE